MKILIRAAQNKQRDHQFDMPALDESGKIIKWNTGNGKLIQKEEFVSGIYTQPLRSLLLVV